MVLPRATHDLSHYVLQSMNMGKLVPIGVREVLPGTTARMNTNVLMRLAPLNTPVMHPVNVIVHHWFVPTRHLQTNWEKFITGGPDGEDATVLPYITSPAGGFAVGSLGNYLGLNPLPSGNTNTYNVSAYPFRAFNQIYNHFYRDEQLQTERAVSLGDGADAVTATTLPDVNWNKDRFTAARPEPQLGTEVYLPIGSEAPILSTGQKITLRANGTPDTTVDMKVGSSYFFPSPGATDTNSFADFGADGTEITSLVVDLSETLGIPISELRRSSAIQRFMESRNRAGARYDEYLMSGFGVKSSDARLQLPEYLGGSSQTVQFSEVLGTANNTDTTLGELGGHGIAAMRSNAFERFFEEHGFIISVMYVRPVTMYMNGQDKFWTYQTKYDFFQRELQQIGDQEVYLREIYTQGTAADATVFGFEPRNQHHRKAFSRVAGEMATTALNTWHFGRDLSAAPGLNSEFITCTPTTRPFVSSVDDTLIVYAKHNIKFKSVVSNNSTPKLM